MCLKDAITELRRQGIQVSESSIRWAIKTNKVTRPHLDGSLRFDFSDENIAEIAMHFGKRGTVLCS